MYQAGRPAAEYIFAQFPGLDQHITVEEYMRESAELQAEYFKTVEPMRGAVNLVRGLVRFPQVRRKMSRA